jgi:hypothetical protein
MDGWTLLYRGTEHGFRVSHFHNKCDGKPNTVTIILTTNGFIFGGFTPVAWNSNSASKALFSTFLPDLACVSGPITLARINCTESSSSELR